jgi:dCTP diphosphatase
MVSRLSPGRVGPVACSERERPLTLAVVESGVKDEFQSLTVELRAFASERDWDQFHSPKNLAMALIVEAGELVEPFQWLTEEQSRNLPPEKLRQVSEELADVQIYLIRLADRLGIDLARATREKIARNRHKYPAAKVRGKARKYDEYTQ